jgi:hypothetical protein
MFIELLSDQRDKHVYSRFLHLKIIATLSPDLILNDLLMMSWYGIADVWLKTLDQKLRIKQAQGLLQKLWVWEELRKTKT